MPENGVGAVSFGALNFCRVCDRIKKQCSKKLKQIDERKG